MFMSKRADVLVDDLKEFIAYKKFSKRDDLVKLIQSFMRFFIANLTRGSESQARKILERHNF